MLYQWVQHHELCAYSAFGPASDGRVVSLPFELGRYITYIT